MGCDAALLRAPLVPSEPGLHLLGLLLAAHEMTRCPPLSSSAPLTCL